MSSVESLRVILTNDTYRAMVRYCKDPHSTSEIIQYLLSKFSAVSSNRDYWERLVSDALPSLEKFGGLVYTGGKWQTTQIGKDILNKYFGGL